MDTALKLKYKIAKKEDVALEEAISLLEQSSIFNQLLSDFEFSTINLLHRLIELAEIPFSSENEKVRGWRNQLADRTFCGEGFSLTGEKEDLLACYNAMITSVLIRLDYPNSERIKKGIDWIIDYQNTERNRENRWKEKGIEKYGGCMKSTPCYIGIVKSMIALTDFKIKYANTANNELENKLNKGLNYILEHKVFKRKSTESPITKDITKLAYPFTYKTNIIEILRLLNANQLVNDPSVKDAKELLIKKRKKDGFWRINSFYKPKDWVDFDRTKEKAEWLTLEINDFLK